MNERLIELYNKSLVLEGNGDYVAGELDPVKFAELIIRECHNLIVVGGVDDVDAILEEFGVNV